MLILLGAVFLIVAGFVVWGGLSGRFPSMLAAIFQPSLLGKAS